MDEKMARIEEDLRRVCYKIKKKGREILSDFDITPPQFEALQFLINDERLTISELSNNMFLACSTVTDLLDRMERNELVKRVKDDQDRRIVRIMVLPKGHELLNKVIETRIRYIEAMLSDVDEATRESIESSVRVLNERVEI
ncbi:MAG: MarR family transcriptional regulator, organic hydroperoxide resistance regulator [Clostridiales bacterium]|jgi:DNA-binding MarR family transcriptional regulator|nr:MarR family transcriptional regulator, organic hydroperoxide resistance regulator [Clostridiales bacterium]MDN5298652.1 MarR family transcriptional regulator, organic hydroperoxide resistance regulator [Clostridiales bacterium]